MPTFKRCDESIDTLAKTLLTRYETHLGLIVGKVTVDFAFAYCDRDDKGNALNDALTKNGIKALGVTRKIPLKDRALGRADAEIVLDGDWWEKATADEQTALLDHDLHHIAVKTDKSGNIQYDDLGRAQIVLRKHDVEVGWFKVIAERHGEASQERIQAKAIMDCSGQYFWPDLTTTIQISSGDAKTPKMDIGTFSKAIARNCASRETKP